MEAEADFMISPRFTIILPVRNGGIYLQHCVASILAQTVSNFDLAVLENQSSDGSAGWLKQLNDPRVKVYPAPTALSIEDNWGRIAQIPRNEFITCIGHDDLLDPNYLEVMQELIKRFPNAGLYQAHFRLIDENDDFLRWCAPQPERETAGQFLEARFCARRESFGTGYMMRTTDFDRVGGMPHFPQLLFSDDVLWMKLMLGSWKATSPQPCFSYRFHGGSAGAIASVTTWIDAAHCYISALQQMAAQESGIAQVYIKHGPHFFQGWFIEVLMRAMGEAMQSGHRTDPRLFRAIFREAKRISPPMATQLGRMKIIRRHYAISRTDLTWRFYLNYLRLRYGRTFPESVSNS